MEQGSHVEPRAPGHDRQMPPLLDLVDCLLGQLGKKSRRKMRVWINDIDQMVKFFRQNLGRRAIKTKRGFGYYIE